ncbi:hypothetical protein [Algibacter pacificus]|uniref:hypothetical protein n=1 Tax=Algibacter pacificus TaxID=2599389 RepID=UPI0011C96EB1|nr:hypothetical protein [Algibacter pacificus]
MNKKLDITTSIGFYLTYFDLLPVYKTREDAFNFLNDQTEYIAGRKLYYNYSHFRQDLYGSDED